MINPRVTVLDFYWPGVKEIVPLVQSWANIIYYEKKFISEDNGLDFYTDKSLNKISNKTDLIVTRWGRDYKTSFYCVSGYGLYDVIPWWEKMQKFFERELNLTPWLPFPCILLSQSILRRHADLGRPTAFNYPIFGEGICTNYLWHQPGCPDSEYNETYSYSEGKTILIDTTYEHGSFLNSRQDAESTRSICNMGFKESYDICLPRILDAKKLGKFEKLYE